MTDTDRPSLASVYAPMAAVGLTVIVVDQLTKAWAVGLTPCAERIPRPTLGFCLAFNEGMAFSAGWGRGPIISLVAVLIVSVLVFSARKVPMTGRLLMGAVAGGALGNVIDRAFRVPAPGSSSSGFMSGAVVDFVYSSFWATFNVADAAIVVGGILLSIVLWRLPDPDAEPDSEADPDSEAEPEPEPQPTQEPGDA